MNWLRKNKYLLAAGLLGCSTFVGMTVLMGCASGMKHASKPGAQLWGETCGRCHNVRSITGYEDSEWSVVIQHMRTRASLSGDEAHKIVKFLKASN